MSCVGTSCPPQGRGARPLQPQEAAPFLPWYMGARGAAGATQRADEGGAPGSQGARQRGRREGAVCRSPSERESCRQRRRDPGRSATQPGRVARALGPTHGPAPAPPASFSLVQELGSRGSLSASQGTEHFLRFLLSPAANWPHNTDKDKS